MGRICPTRIHTQLAKEEDIDHWHCQRRLGVMGQGEESASSNLKRQALTWGDVGEGSFLEPDEVVKLKESITMAPPPMYPCGIN